MIAGVNSLFWRIKNYWKSITAPKHSSRSLGDLKMVKWCVLPLWGVPVLPDLLGVDVLEFHSSVKGVRVMRGD